MLSFILTLIMVLMAIVSLAVGPADIGVLATLKALSGSGSQTDHIIIWEIRAPRTALAMLIGATLAMSGAALQGFVRNPLASPSLLGTSNFAALGAVIALYFGTSQLFSLSVPLAAIFCALLSVIALSLIAGRDSRLLTLILAGLALSSLASALTALALNLSSNPFAALEIAFWLLGSLSDRSTTHLLFAAPFMALSWALLLYDRRALQALTLGEDVAQTLGFSVLNIRRRLILAVALGVGASVAISGVIGFIGLVVPHLIRPLTSYDPGRALIPSALAGACLLTAADIAVRLIPSSTELKLGVLTALIGVPFFLFLVLRERQGRAAFL